MRLYAVVIGREPKYDPYIAYMDSNQPVTRGFAVFEYRRQAEKWKKENNILGRVVRFEPSPTRGR